MQASSCTQTQLNMFTKRNSCKPNRKIGTNEKSIESYQGNWASIKRKKIDTTDWPVPVAQGGKQSDKCVFTWDRLTICIHESIGIDQTSHRRASNHRYRPGHKRVAVLRGRQLFVPRRLAGTRCVAGSITSGWTQHADNWWVQGNFFVDLIEIGEKSEKLKLWYLKRA